jgi:hypothetical protein
MKTADEINRMTLNECNDELGAMGEYSLHSDENEAREALRIALSRLNRYTVTDGNHCEVGLSFEESVGVIADWWEDAADWHSLENEERYVIRGAIRQAIESVESPEYGDVDTLQDYAKRICQAVALAIGSQDFAGHGSYQVSAAERAGFVLIVKEEVQ